VSSGANAVLAASEYARENGATRVVVVGASMGGTAAMVAAGSDTDGLLDAAADLSGPIEFSGVFASDYATNVTVPLFFAVSENDMAVTVDELENLGGQTASEQIRFTPGIGHGWDMLFEGSGAQSAVATALVEFIQG
jgi:dienelactone hydrolase